MTILKKREHLLLITGKKNMRLQEIIMENYQSVISIVDDAGIYLPLHNETFRDKEYFGRIFRMNALMGAMDITQTDAVVGSFIAG